MGKHNIVFGRDKMRQRVITCVTLDPRYVGVYEDYYVYHYHSKYYGLHVETQGTVRVALSIQDGHQRVCDSKVFGRSVLIRDAWCRKVSAYANSPHVFTTITDAHRIYYISQMIEKNALSREFATQRTLRILHLATLPKCVQCDTIVASKCVFHVCGAMLCDKCSTKVHPCVQCKQTYKGATLVGAMDAMMRLKLKTQFYQCDVCRAKNLQWGQIDAHVKQHCYVLCLGCNFEVRRWQRSDHISECAKCDELHKCGEIHECVVPCPRGCGMKFNVHDMIQHETKEECPKYPVQCGYECGVVAAQEDIVRHFDICPQKVISCENKCGEHFPRSDQKEHVRICRKVIIDCGALCHTSYERGEKAQHEKVCGRVQVQCRFKCGEVVLRHYVGVHERMTCPRRIVECEECAAQVEYKNMEAHKTICADAVIECPNQCGKSFPRFYMDTHFATMCAKHNLECSRKCGGIFLRESAEAHDKICPDKETLCPLGCGIRLKRGDRAAHYESCPTRFSKCTCGLDFDTQIFQTTDKCYRLPTMKNRIEHRQVCPRVKITCECKAIFERSEQTTHEATCIEKLIKCEKCGEMYARKEQSAHSLVCEMKQCACGEMYKDRMKHIETCQAYVDLCPVENCLYQGPRGNMPVHTCPQTFPSTELEMLRPGVRYDMVEPHSPVRVVDVWQEDNRCVVDVRPDVSQQGIFWDIVSEEGLFWNIIHYLPFRTISQYGLYIGKSVRARDKNGAQCKTRIRAIDGKGTITFEIADAPPSNTRECPEWGFFNLFDESDLEIGMCFHAKCAEKLIVVQIQGITSDKIMLKELTDARDITDPQWAPPNEVGQRFTIARKAAKDHLSLLGFDLPESIKPLKKRKTPPGYVYVEVTNVEIKRKRTDGDAKLTNKKLRDESKTYDFASAIHSLELLMKCGATSLEYIKFLTTTEVMQSCKSWTRDRTQAIFECMRTDPMKWMASMEVHKKLETKGFAATNHFLGHKARASRPLTMPILTNSSDLLCFFGNQVLYCNKS